MNLPEETGVNIVIKGDASSAVAATTLASAAINHLRVDLAGLGEETQRQMSLIPPPPAVIHPQFSRPQSAPPSNRRSATNIDSDRPSSIRSSSAETFVPPARTRTAPIDEFSNIASAPVTPAHTPVETSPTVALPSMPPPDSDEKRGSFEKNPRIDQQNPRATDQPARRPMTSSPPAFAKLHELRDATVSDSARTGQMLESLIQTHRVTAQIHARQQAEIDALKSQLRTLLAQVGNNHFNTQ